MAAVIENVRSPVDMQAKAWVFVLVESGAVEARQCTVILRKVAGYPVQ